MNSFNTYWLNAYDVPSIFLHGKQHGTRPIGSLWCESEWLLLSVESGKLPLWEGDMLKWKLEWQYATNRWRSGERTLRVRFRANTKIYVANSSTQAIFNLDPHGLSLRPHHAPFPWKVPCLFISKGNVFPFSLLQLPLTLCDSPISAPSK